MPYLVGTTASEILNGTWSSDTIQGRGGDDDLYGNGGSDLLDGGPGNDLISGGAGNDVIVGGDGINDLWGDSGYDTFAVSQRTAGAFSDDLVWDFHFDVDQIDVSAWGVSDFSQVEALLQCDSYGDATLDAFYAGQDHWLTLNGISPVDLISTDFVYANPAAITATGTSLDDVMFGSRVDDVLAGASGNDVLLGGLGNDRLSGGSGDDALIGGDGNEIISASTGNDYLEGDGGADRLNGGAGNDVLYGDSGNDIVRGGAGTDDLYGGSGADRFVFANGEFGGMSQSTADYIGDFHHSEGDRIDLRLVDAIAGGTDNAFTFVGCHSFSQVAGELRYFESGGETFVQGDTNGDGQADFLIMLAGSHELVAADFFL